MSSESSKISAMNVSRRRFLSTTGGATLAVPLFPNITTAAKAGSKPAIVGEGAFQYECHHGWGAVPEHIRWADTHGVAIDGEGFVYIKHRGGGKEPMDTIAVFEPGTGKFVRSFGKEYFGGGHGIDIREEEGEEYLYLSDTRNGIVAKTTLKGDQIWTKSFPVDCGFYGEEQRFSPTNIAFAPDGGFYVADGYGSSYIHQYDKNDNWVRTWGGKGSRIGAMSTPHSIWLDDRPGRDVSLVVADRANARLQYFSLDGIHLGFVDAVSFPADFDTQGEIMLVPDLHARISLFDKENQVVTHLGYSQEWTDQALGDGFKMRRTPAMWEDGRFVHPHDACFDTDGNIYVAEWVASGRVSFLKKV